MTNEMKLLVALCEALGFEVKAVLVKKSPDENIYSYKLIKVKQDE